MNSNQSRFINGKEQVYSHEMGKSSIKCLMNDEYMLDECRAFGVNIKVTVIMHSEHSLLNGLLVVSKCRDQTKNKK